MKRLFFVAGESSGDLHGANLIRALRAQTPDILCEGLGGPLMAGAGMTLRHDLASDAIMGFVEVVRRFPAIRRLFLDTVQHLEANRPDALVLIDYPGFNLRLAKRAAALGIPVIYYISPQVWAWKKKRIHTIAQCVGKMLVIFPFEEDFYRRAGVPCSYVGHPLIDHIAAFRPTMRFEGEPVIALLPGSREQEIARLMHVMVGVAQGIRSRMPGARFVSAAVDEARARQIRAAAGDFPVDVCVGAMYDILATARFALVASGTATIETALFGVPMAIVYRVNPLTYWLARALVHIEFIGMANILAGRSVVPEFIQHEAAPEKILPLAMDLIGDTPARARMLSDLAEVRAILGAGGASERAAAEILGFLSEGTP